MPPTAPLEGPLTDLIGEVVGLLELDEFRPGLLRFGSYAEFDVETRSTGRPKRCSSSPSSMSSR